MEMMDTVQQELRRDPMKWAGVAAGGGLGLGLLGRYLRHRARARKRPRLFVIEPA